MHSCPGATCRQGFAGAPLAAMLYTLLHADTALLLFAAVNIRPCPPSNNVEYDVIQTDHRNY